MIRIKIDCERHTDEHSDVLETTEATIISGQGDGMDDAIVTIDNKDYWFNKVDLIKAIQAIS